MRSRSRGSFQAAAVGEAVHVVNPPVVRMTRWIREGKSRSYRIAVDMLAALTVCKTTERLHNTMFSAEYNRHVRRDTSRYAMPGPIVLPLDQDMERFLAILTESTAEAEAALRDAESRSLGLALLDYWLNGADEPCEEYAAWSEGGAPWWVSREEAGV